jgi:hypothetical protein
MRHLRQFVRPSSRFAAALLISNAAISVHTASGRRHNDLEFHHRRTTARSKEGCEVFHCRASFGLDILPPIGSSTAGDIAGHLWGAGDFCEAAG